MDYDYSEVHAMQDNPSDELVYLPLDLTNENIVLASGEIP